MATIEVPAGQSVLAIVGEQGKGVCPTCKQEKTCVKVHMITAEDEHYPAESCWSCLRRVFAGMPMIRAFAMNGKAKDQGRLFEQPK